MEPKFYNGDKLFVSPLFFKLREPRAGDAVVVKDPRGGRFVLKRIGSIEGDRYFVRGDNLEWSTDSREFGGVSRDAIVGKVIFRYSRKISKLIK